MEFNLLFFNLFFELIVLYDIYLKPLQIISINIGPAAQHSVQPDRAVEMGFVWPFQPQSGHKVKLVDVSVKKECVM